MFLNDDLFLHLTSLFLRSRREGGGKWQNQKCINSSAKNRLIRTISTRTTSTPESNPLQNMNVKISRSKTKVTRAYLYSLEIQVRHPHKKMEKMWGKTSGPGILLTGPVEEIQ
jgi:hypothetical protein